MSALSIGSSAFPTAPSREDGLTAIVKWVPGEVIGAYAALVLALDSGERDPRAVTGTQWLWVFAAGALVMALVGGALEWRRQNPSAVHLPADKRAELVIRGILAFAAFLLWSLVIPGSASTQGWSWGVANAHVLPIVVPFAAVVFGLVAEYTLLPGSIAVLLRIPPLGRAAAARHADAAPTTPTTATAATAAQSGAQSAALPVAPVLTPAAGIPLQTTVTLGDDPESFSTITLPPQPEPAVVLPDDLSGGPQLPAR